MLDLGSATVTYQHNATTENFLPVSSPDAPSHITTLQREASPSAAASWFLKLHLSAEKKQPNSCCTLECI